MTYFYYAPITFILVSRVTNLCFTLFNVSRETYYICKRSGWYIIEKGLFQTLVVFHFIVSIVLYQKITVWISLRRICFWYNHIRLNTELKWISLSSLLFNVSRETYLYKKEFWIWNKKREFSNIYCFLIHYKYSVISKIIVWVS